MATQNTIGLRDGRRLAYAEYGDPGGVPVVACHGGLSCRLDSAAADAPAAALGVRVIAPDRPGIGVSDRRAGRRLLDWPDDVAQLADALGLGSFAVLGWSLGGPFAAVCAFALAGRVSALGLVASTIPAGWPGMREQLNAMDRRLIGLTLHAPPAAKAVLWGMGAAARRSPRRFTERSLRELDDHSRRVLAAGPGGALAAEIGEGLRQPAGVLDDYRIFAAPWGFDPAAIAVPAHVWQGDADTLVPAAWGQRLAARIPGAVLHPCPGEGHFLGRERAGEILRTLTTAAGAVVQSPGA